MTSYRMDDLQYLSIKEDQVAQLQSFKDDDGIKFPTRRVFFRVF